MTINCRGKLIDFSSPKVMGILNITPDSFYDGGYYKNEKEVLYQTEKMLLEGASFIDVGAYSSKPGAAHISEKEELNRIIPVIKSISMLPYGGYVNSVAVSNGKLAAAIESTNKQAPGKVVVFNTSNYEVLKTIKPSQRPHLPSVAGLRVQPCLNICQS